VADVDELKKKNTRGTSLMECGCHVSNDQVNNGAGGPKLPKNQNIRVCFVFKLVKGP